MSSPSSFSSSQAPDADPFDTLLNLESQFYNEGYNLGLADGHRAGLHEGRAFGLEKGFEKFVAMGRMHGRARVWGGRLPSPEEKRKEECRTEERVRSGGEGVAVRDGLVQEGSSGGNAVDVGERAGHAPQLSRSARLEGHVRTLFALTEPGSLDTRNEEGAIADFEDRLRRAEGKVKVIEKITGESLRAVGEASGDVTKKEAQGDGSIEDISVLHARH